MDSKVNAQYEQCIKEVYPPGIGYGSSSGNVNLKT